MEAALFLLMNFLRDLKVKTKLLLLVAGFSLGLLLFALVAFNTIETLRIKGPNYREIIAGEKAIADVLPPPKYIIESYLLALQMADRANRAQLGALAQRARDLRAEYNARQDVWLEDELLPDDVRQNLTQDSHNAALDFFEVRDTQLLPAVRAGNYALASQLVNGDLRRHYERHRAAIDQVVVGATQFNKDVEKRSDALIVQRRWLMIILAVAVFGLAGVGLGMGLGRSITRSLGETASSLSATSAEMAATIEQHERTAVMQSAAVHQTTTTMDELDASFAQTAEMVKVASDTAENAASDAQNGLETVRQTLDGMNVLREKVGAVSDQIQNLSEQINQVGQITKVVGDLANQTNMLALNAAVEAARAGEHGKGFGVVAAEIRKLADESRKGVERINAIVEEIKRANDATVMATEEGAKTVESDIELARQTAQVFSGIVESSHTALEAAQQTLLAVPQQVAAVRQVLAAMEDLNRGAKETADGLGQTKDSVENLRDAAQKLKLMI